MSMDSSMKVRAIKEFSCSVIGKSLERLVLFREGVGLLVLMYSVI